MGSEAKEMLELQNIKPGVGNTRMAKWKYEIYREAILKAVPPGAQGITFKELPAAVSKKLPAEKRSRLGSVTWHVTSVKLDLEARGILERIPGKKPQHLRLTEKGLAAIAAWAETS